MKTITVEVTQADIDAGLRGNCAKCPVALALNRATGEEWLVYEEYAIRNCDHLDVPLPGECQSFVERFDEPEEDDVPIAPFSFTIEVPA